MRLLSDSHVRARLLSTLYDGNLASNVAEFLDKTFSIDYDPTLLYTETLLIVGNSDLPDPVKDAVQTALKLQTSTVITIPEIGHPIMLKELTKYDAAQNQETRNIQLTPVEDRGNIHVLTLPAGTTLYTGQKREPTSGPIFLSEIYDVAVPYGIVYEFILTSDVNLVLKTDAKYALQKGNVERGAWNNFGSSVGDGPIARAIARNRSNGRERYAWIQGFDGWVEQIHGSDKCSEIMLCDMKALQRRMVTKTHQSREQIVDKLSKLLDVENMHINIPAVPVPSAVGWSEILYRAVVPPPVHFLTIDYTPAAGVMPFIYIPNDGADGGPSFVSHVAHNMARYVQGGIIDTGGRPMERDRIDIIQKTLQFMHRFPGRGWRHKFNALYRNMDVQGMVMHPDLQRNWSAQDHQDDRNALELRSIRGPRPSGGRGGRGDPNVRAQIEALNYRRGVRRRRAIAPDRGAGPRGPHGNMSEGDKAWLRCTVTPFGHFVRFLIEFWKQNSERIEDYEAIVNQNIPPLLQAEIQRFLTQADVLDRLFNRFRHCFCAGSKIITSSDVVNANRRNHLFHWHSSPPPDGPFQDADEPIKGGYRPFRYDERDPAPQTDQHDKMCLLAIDSPDQRNVSRWVQLNHGNSNCARPDDQPAENAWPHGFGRYLQLITQIRDFLDTDASSGSEGAIDPLYRVTAKYHIPPDLLNHNIAYGQTFVRGVKAVDSLRIGDNAFIYRVSSVPEDLQNVDPAGSTEQTIDRVINHRHIPFFWRDAI